VQEIVVLNDFFDLPGGGTAVARATATILAAQGFRVTFIVGAGPDQAELPGCETVGLGLTDIRQVGRLSASARALYDRSAARRLERALAGRDPARTTVLLHQWTRVLSASVFRVLRPYRTLLFAHDFFAACPNGALYDFQRNEPCGVRPLSSGCLLRNCDRESPAHKAIRVGRTLIQNSLFSHMADLNIVFVSRGQAERYGHVFPPSAKKHVLGNVPEAPARDVAPRADVRTAEARLLFVGRMTPEKGVAELAEAGRLLGEPIEFLGDGPLRAELERSYPEHSFLPWGGREEVERRMAASRLVVVPSRWPETSALVPW
jgi:glycosyltransferase involved in cell wall biosynthesis